MLDVIEGLLDGGSDVLFDDLATTWVLGEEVTDVEDFVAVNDELLVFLLAQISDFLRAIE